MNPVQEQAEAFRQARDAEQALELPLKYEDENIPRNYG